jgi:hypothetical protein
MLWIHQPYGTRIEPVVDFSFGRLNLPNKPAAMSRKHFRVAEVGVDSVTVEHQGQVPGRVVGGDSERTVGMGERVVIHVGEKYFPIAEWATFLVLTVDGCDAVAAEILPEPVVTVVPIAVEEILPEPVVTAVPIAVLPDPVATEAPPEPVVATAAEILPEPVVPIVATEEEKLPEPVVLIAANAAEILPVESPVQPPAPEPPKKARPRKNTRPMRVAEVEEEEGGLTVEEDRELHQKFLDDDEADIRFKDALLKTAAYTAYILSNSKEPKFLVKPVEALSLERDRIPLLEKMRAAKLRSDELEKVDNEHKFGKDAGFPSAALIDKPKVPEPEVDAQWAPFARPDVPEELGELLEGPEVQPAPKKKRRVIKPTVVVP